MRDIDGRLEWLLGNKPLAAGRCAEHVMHALDVPRQGLPDATAVANVVMQDRNMHQGACPRGALRYWTGGAEGHGHVGIEYAPIDQPAAVASTDVGGPRTVGVRELSWFARNWPALKYVGWSWHFGAIDTQPKEVPMSDEYWLDDPNAPLIVGRKYVRFSRDWDPKTSGLQHGKRYSKNTPKFRAGKDGGALRFKAVRTGAGAADDPTWYHDEGVTVDMLDDEGCFLRSFSSFEKGDDALNLHWEVKCVGGMESCTIQPTRYAGMAVQD